MILITGATGNIGSALLPLLARQGASVRAIAHSESAHLQVEDLGFQAVEGDFDRPDTLEAAMQGCDRLFLLSPPNPTQPERERAAIDAAKRAGVTHVVALSVLGAGPSSSQSFSGWHGEIDDYLVGSGIPYTILRPSGFMQVHLLPVDTVKQQGVWYGMTGEGATGYIDAADVGEVAAHVLTTEGHTGAIYELTGPEAISMPQAAGQLSEVIGRDVTYVDVPADQFRANLGQFGLPDWLADAIQALYQSIREGHAALVTDHVEKVIGRPARSYRQFAEDHRDAFAS
jgi:uncharacterized protein YbjT (DUF2867 family)